MARETIAPPDGPKPSGSYSPGVRAGDFVFVSGQGPVDPATGKMAGDDIRSQVQQVLRNVESILQATGLTLDDVVRIDAYLADLNDFDAYDEAYRAFFPANPPARTTVQSG